MNYDGAIADFDQVIKLDWNFSDAHMQRCDIYYASGDWEKASQDYDSVVWSKRKIADTDMQKNIARYGRGLAKLRNGDAAAGNADMAAAKSIDPNIETAFASRFTAF